MKAKLFIATIASLIMVGFSSCNSAETIIQVETKAANKQCPISIGNGMTMTSVEYEGMYVVYNIKGDESLYTFSQDMVSNAMKDQMVSTLRSKASIDPKTERFVKALIERNVGMIYHYYTDSSVMDVIIQASDLAREEEPVEEVVEVVGEYVDEE